MVAVTVSHKSRLTAKRLMDRGVIVLIGIRVSTMLLVMVQTPLLHAEGQTKDQRHQLLSLKRDILTLVTYLWALPYLLVDIVVRKAHQPLKLIA